MFARSQVLGDTLDWVRSLARLGRYRLFSLNNESRALHEHRVATFRLDEVFAAFFTSCYLGMVKPDEEIYTSALGMAACAREGAVFVDDRALNVEPASVLGLRAVHFQGLDDLRSRLREYGVTA
jgi:putative hydrolase of the HAD superfamily